MTMKRLAMWCSLAALSSCKFLDSWAAAATPVATDGSTPPAGSGVMLPTVGGGDPIDIVVTVLTVLGLPAVARLLMVGKPLLMPLLRALWPKKPEPPKPPDAV
jgi:hypothetical protein